MPVQTKFRLDLSTGNFSKILRCHNDTSEIWPQGPAFFANFSENSLSDTSRAVISQVLPGNFAEISVSQKHEEGPLCMTKKEGGVRVIFILNFPTFLLNTFSK